MINTYKFEELSKDVQERIIDEYIEIQECNNDLEEYLKDRLKELTGLTTFNLSYDLNGSQGDGLCFTGSIEGHEIDSMPYANLVKDAENTIINIFPKSGWCGSYMVDIDIDADTCYDSQEYYGDEWEKLQTAVEDWYNSIRDKLEDEGYKYIEEMENDERIREILIRREAYYTIEGEEI